MYLVLDAFPVCRVWRRVNVSTSNSSAIICHQCSSTLHRGRRTFVPGGAFSRRPRVSIPAPRDTICSKIQGMSHTGTNCRLRAGTLFHRGGQSVTGSASYLPIIDRTGAQPCSTVAWVQAREHGTIACRDDDIKHGGPWRRARKPNFAHPEQSML